MKKRSTLLTMFASLALSSSCGNVVSSAPPPPPPIVISPNTVPTGTVGFAYSLTLSAAGGQVPYTWSVSAGALPPGLNLNANTGVLSGVPTASGTSNFTVQAADSSTPARTGGMPFTLVINPQLSFTISSLPDGAVGVAYDANASVSGGTTPYTWSVVSGSLPPGLSLNSATGTITGTPTTAGSFGLGLKVTDSSVPQQTAKFFSGIVVYPTLTITSTSLPDGLVGTPYSATLTASGGTGSYTWSIVSGTLPAGVSLDPNSGILSGTPTSAGQANFTVQVTDTANPPQTPSLPLSLNIAAAGANDRLMKGSYAFLLQGFDSNGAVAMAGKLDADGAGSITGGAFDIERVSDVQRNVMIPSGQFTINSDNRGTVTIQSALGSQTFQLAMNATGALAHFIEFDTSSPHVIRGNGIMKRCIGDALPQLQWSGSYAFSFSGSTASGRRSAILGSFAASAAGAIGAGSADANSDGAVLQQAAIESTSSYRFAANGRGALHLLVNGLGNISGAAYFVSASESFFVRTDAPGSDLLAGEILRQSGSPFSATSLAGARMLRIEGQSPSGSTVFGIGVVNSENSVDVSGTYDSNDGGSVMSRIVSDGTFEITSADFGRGTMKFAGNDLTLYVVDSAMAFVMDAEGEDVKVGMLEGQSVSAPLVSWPSGQFAEGSEISSNASATFESGVLSIGSAGALVETTDRNLVGNILSAANATGGRISLVAKDRFTTGRGTIYYVISPTRMIKVQTQSGQTSASLVIADQ